MQSMPRQAPVLLRDVGGVNCKFSALNSREKFSVCVSHSTD